METASNVKRVLVLDADMVSALAIARSLHRHGLQVDVASATPHPLTAYSASVSHVLQYPDPLTDEAGFTEWLATCLTHTAYALLIPVTERTVTPIAKHRNRFADTCLALASDAALAQVLDKQQTLRLATTLQIPSPRSVHIAQIENLEDASSTLSFPIVIKPASSFGAHDAQRVQLSVEYAFDARELHDKAQHALRYGPILLQEYVGGQGIGIELIADRGKIIYAFQHRRLHEVPLTGGGSSLRISDPIDPALLDASQKLMQALAWHGVAMVEFKRDRHKGAFSLMEINGRFWGSLPLAIAAGADFPAMLYELMIKGTITPRAPARIGIYGCNLARDLYWTELALRRVGPAKLVSFPSKAQIFKDWLKVFSPHHRFDVQQWRDPRPGLVELWRIGKDFWQRGTRILAERRLAKQLQRHWQSGVVARKMQGAKSVLFICYGNINRSILAERYFQTKTIGMPIASTSAGFHIETGRPADPTMVEMAQKHAIDLTGAASRHVNAELLQQADAIFVMEGKHYLRIANDFPEALERTFLLDACGEIDDPYGKSPEIYEKCLQQVTRDIDQLITLLK